MQPIIGLKIQELPIKGLKKVEDLLYFDGPLLSFYMSESDDCFLFYWVDVDNEYNRWVVFPVRLIELNDFLNKKISLLKLYESALNGYIIDIDNSLNYNNIQLAQLLELPSDYIPSKDSFFLNDNSKSDVILKYFSLKYGKGIMQTHFSDGDGIGYGSINLTLFSELMNHFSELNEGMGNSFYKYEKKRQTLRKRKYADKKDFTEKPINRIEYKSSYSFDIVTPLAASFSLLFKPTDTELNFEDSPTRADKYMEFFTSFISDSESIEKLKDYSKDIDASTINQYESMLDLINKSHCKLQITYLNTKSSTHFSREIDSRKAKKIIQNLEFLDFDNDESISLIGKFTSLNLKLKTYSFESADDKSSGDLVGDAIIKSNEIAFNKTYLINIERKTVKKASGKKMKHTDFVTTIEEVLEKQIEIQDIPTTEIQ